jgi:DNA-binding winged helix-turn-helix (wHTH) protein/WD40 repeat protein
LHQATKNPPDRLRFGPFEIDRLEGRLYKRGTPLRIENHPFQVLVALLERPDDVVTREELQQRIWGDDINVGFEDGLNTAVRKLRFALGDSADSPVFIETIPKRGYRFVAPLSPATPDLHTPSDNSIRIVKDPEQDPLEASDTPPAQEISSRLRFIVAITFVAVTIATLLLWRNLRSDRPETNTRTIQAQKLDGIHARESVALSPDGRYVAYARWDGQQSSLRMRQVANAGEVEVLAPRNTNYIGLTFSPDGDDLYFVSNNEGNPHYRSLYRMPALGGPTQKLIEDIDSPVGFSPDGRRFVFLRFRASTSTLEIRTANADGSAGDLFAQFPEYAWGCFLPQAAWSPDGRTVAVPVRGTADPAQSSLYAIDVATRRSEKIYSANGCIGHPAWVDNHTLIFSHEGSLRTVTEPVGRMTTATKPASEEIRRLTGYGGSLSEQISLSRDRKTGVATGNQSNKGLWVASPKSAFPPQPLLSGDASLSAVDELAGGRLLVTKADGSIWTTRNDGSDWQRLASVRGWALSCGQFAVVQKDDNSLVRFNADGTGESTLVRTPTKTPTCSLKGDSVFYLTPGQPQQIMRVPIAGGDPVIIAKIQDGVPVTLRVSRDGNLMAYSSYKGTTADSRFSVSVLRASDGKVIDAIADAKLGAWNFCWSPDGKGLDYISAKDQLADVWTKSLAGSGPTKLTNFGSGEINDFHWSRDGARLLVVWGPANDDVVLLRDLQ